MRYRQYAPVSGAAELRLGDRDGAIVRPFEVTEQATETDGGRAGQDANGRFAVPLALHVPDEFVLGEVTQQPLRARDLEQRTGRPTAAHGRAQQDHPPDRKLRHLAQQPEGQQTAEAVPDEVDVTLTRTEIHRRRQAFEHRWRRLRHRVVVELSWRKTDVREPAAQQTTFDAGHPQSVDDDDRRRRACRGRRPAAAGHDRAA